MSAKYKSPSFLLPNELNTSTNTANDTGINSLYSMDFDGSSSVINLGNTDAVKLGAGDFTFSAWINPNSWGSGYEGIYSNNSTNGVFIGKDNAGNFVLRITGVSNVISYSTLPTVNTWTHICITRLNGTCTLYYNGSSVATGSSTQNFNANTNVYIGGDPGTGPSTSALMNGKIDEVAIFNRALNTTEIAALYDGTGSNIRPSNIMATDLNPVAYYPLGEQAQNSGKLPDATGSEWQFPNGVLQDYVMDFDSTSPGDYVSLGDLTTVESSEFTISMWVNKDNIATNSVLFNSGTAAAPNNSVTFQHTGSTFYIAVGGAGAQTLNPGLSSGVWYNFILTVNGTTAKLYIDGSQFGSNITVGSVRTGIGSEAVLGKYNFGTYANLDGKISNVAIWNSDQSTNVANIYNNGSPQTTYTVTPQNWWKLNSTSVYTPSAPNYTKALDFNGSSDYISLSNNTLINTTSHFTISGWFNLDSIDSGGYSAAFALKTNSNHSFVAYISNQGGYAGVAFGEAGSGNAINTSTNVSSLFINKWANLTITYNGSGIGSSSNYNLYINGQAQTLTSNNGFSGYGNVNLLGYYSNTGFSNGFNGSISNAAVFNSALTSSQVSTLFNFGTPETAISFSPQAWWKLNDQTAITDSSNNGNTGTNNGATDAPGGVAVTPSWKIPTALPIPTINYTTALDFDPSGSGDYISFGNQSAFQPTSNYTFSIWFKGDSSSYALFGTNSSTSSGVHALLTSTNIIYYHKTTGSIIQFNNPTNLNSWHNFTITWSASTGILRGFIDGKYTQQATGVNDIVWGNELEVGRYNGGAFKYDGKISNFAMWDTALTDGFSGTPSGVAGGQVAEVYNNGQPQASITGSPVGWWKLDDQNAITDYSGNNYTGTNNGAVNAPGDVASPGFNIPVNGVSTTLPSTALQQSDLQFDSPYSNYSLKLDVVSYVDTNFAIPNWTKYAYSIWFKFNGSTIAGYDHLIGNLSGGGNTDGRAIIGFRGTNLYLNMGDGTNYWYDESQSAAPLLDGSWHNIVLNVYETGQDIYVDGSLLRTYTYTGSVTTGTPATSNNFINKSGSASSNNGVDSSVDEHAVFSRLLTTAEILSIYNNGKPNDISSLSPSYWWRLGENAFFNNNSFIVPNSISGAPNGTGSGTITTMISADAPGTYANGIGTNLDIVDRVGDAPLSVANSQSYNMIPSDISPYVPQYVGKQIANNFSMSFDSPSNTSFDLGKGLKSTFDAATKASVSLWFRASSISPSTAAVLFQQESTDAGDNWSFVIRFSTSGQLQTGIKVGSSFPLATYTTALNNVDWYNVVSVYESSTLKLYLNGAKVAENLSTNSPLVTSSSNAKAIVGATALPNRYFNGEIDEVAIFDTALSAGQIYNDIYQPTATGSNKTADLENNPNLPTPVAWYRMGDN